MNIKTSQLIEDLNHNDIKTRLNSLKMLFAKIEQGELKRPKKGNDVNNHIHTFYSFSPYSPTKAVWMAYQAGLATAGMMDHDSISGAREFIAAGEIAHIATTIGIECRVDFSKTVLSGRRINNPDQDSLVYMALHGIPHSEIDKVSAFFRPYREHRNYRNRQMLKIINQHIRFSGIQLDFTNDVIPISKFPDGGSITERHILYALSLKLITAYGKGNPLISFLKNCLNLKISEKIETYLDDDSNPFYAYDLLGLLKSEMVKDFYIDADEECPDVKEVIEFSKKIGAISAYAYLGDVGDSVTGDKRNQKFEDDYIDQLFPVLKELQFNAVTYMPSRNTVTQLDKVRSLCEKYQFFQISGEDINSPRQSFICEALQDPKFQNLIDATWALIGHERAATESLSHSMFSTETIEKYPELSERIKVYQKIGIH